MALTKRVNFRESAEGAQIESILLTMISDKAYSTTTSYSKNSELYPDNRIPFVDKHMNYLTVHPGTDPQQYIANLRLMTRVR